MGKGRTCEPEWRKKRKGLKLGGNNSKRLEELKI